MPQIEETPVSYLGLGLNIYTMQRAEGVEVGVSILLLKHMITFKHLWKN